MYRSWDEVTPDVEIWFETLAGDDRHIAMRTAGRGHAADGGRRDGVRVTMVATVATVGFQRAELFEPGDEAAALARFEELRRADAPVGRAGDPERELTDRYRRGLQRPRLGRSAGIFAPDLRLRRPAPRRLG